jgi:hypothetical protein
VPFHLERGSAPLYRLTNVGAEDLRGITLTLLGPGVMLAGVPTRLAAGASLEFTLRGDNLARSTVVVIRWFRSRGGEYLWRVSF